jgi:hypothetical protein
MNEPSDPQVVAVQADLVKLAGVEAPLSDDALLARYELSRLVLGGVEDSHDPEVRVERAAQIRKAISEAVERHRPDALREIPSILDAHATVFQSRRALAEEKAVCVAAAGELLGLTDETAFRQLFVYYQNSMPGWHSIASNDANVKTNARLRQTRLAVWFINTSYRSGERYREPSLTALAEDLVERVQASQREHQPAPPEVVAASASPEVEELVARVAGQTVESTSASLSGEASGNTPGSAPRRDEPIRDPQESKITDPPTGERLQVFLNRLAKTVGHQLEEDQRWHRLDDPHSLPVTWTNASDELMDHWENIGGDGRRGEQIDFSGSLGQECDTFEGVPAGRLIVLGRGGSGKSVFATRLAAEMFRRRSVDSAVPMILNIATWDPVEIRLIDWIKGQVSGVRPLAPWMRGKSGFDQLVEANLILPILDGFDEMPPDCRAAAISALNSLGDKHRFVLMSREDEFSDAVGNAEAVVRSAGVVRLEALRSADVFEYLRLGTRKSADGIRGETKWSSLLAEPRQRDEIRLDPIVEEVLTTPLMVFLARSIYSESSRDPRELVDRSLLPTASDARNHLLDGFIPAIYERPSRDQMTHASRWSPQEASEWLGFLGLCMLASGRRDFKWWQPLRGLSNRIAYRLGILFLVIGIVAIARNALDSGHKPTAPQVSLALNAILLLSVGASLLFGIGMPARGFQPIWRRSRSIRAGGAEVNRTTWVMGVAMLSMIIILPRFFVWARGQDARSWWLITEVDLDSLPGAAGWALPWCILVPVSLVYFYPMAIYPRGTTPARLLRDDRIAMILGILLTGLASTATAVEVWPLIRPDLRDLMSILILIGVLPPLCYAATTVWFLRCLPQVFLGRLPMRTNLFLQDALGRGVLRQVDGAYQFRHALLHDRLALKHIEALDGKIAMFDTRIDAQVYLARSNSGATKENSTSIADLKSLLQTCRNAKYAYGIVNCWYALIVSLENHHRSAEALEEVMMFRSGVPRWRQAIFRLDTSVWELHCRLLNIQGHVDEANQEQEKLVSYRRSRVRRLWSFFAYPTISTEES